MPPQHLALPSAVIQILPGERPQTAAGAVANLKLRVEPYHLPALSQPPVELVVLVTAHGGVVAAHLVQRVAPEHAEIDRVDSARGAAMPVTRAARPQRRRHRRRHRPFEETAPDGHLPSADLRRPRSFERLHRPRHVVRRQDRVSVDPYDHRARRRPQRDAQARRRNPGGVAQQFDFRVAPPQDARHGLGIRSVGDHRFDSACIVLPAHRVERGDDGRFGVPRRHNDRNIRESGRARSRPVRSPEIPYRERRAIAGPGHLLRRRSFHSIRPLDRAAFRLRAFRNVKDVRGSDCEIMFRLMRLSGTGGGPGAGTQPSGVRTAFQAVVPVRVA